MKQLLTASLILTTLLSWHTVQAKPLCRLVADSTQGKMLIREGDCDTRLTPASTFKIPLSLMGYDAGFLKDEHTPLLPYQNDYPALLPTWKNPTDPTSWIENSVVWYSQRIAEALGKIRVQAYVNSFQYGNQDINGKTNQSNGFTHAWLNSSLQISPWEQLSFIEKMLKHQLKVSAHAYEMTDKIYHLTTVNGWEIFGKTGTADPLKSDDNESLPQKGWFVGWAKKDANLISFVEVIADDKPSKTLAGPRARAELLAVLPVILTAADRQNNITPPPTIPEQ